MQMLLAALIRYVHADVDPSCESRLGPALLSFMGKDNHFELATFMAMWLSRFLFHGSSADSPLPHLYPLAAMISHRA